MISGHYNPVFQQIMGYNSVLTSLVFSSYHYYKLLAGLVHKLLQSVEQLHSTEPLTETSIWTTVDYWLI